MIIKRLGKRLGFSLVEVTLALGIASVALLSVVGLLSVAMDTSGDAGQDTSLAAMASQVMGDLHAAPFDGLGQASPRTPLTTKITLPPALMDSAYYFTAEGVPITGASAATSPDAHFECVVKKTVDDTYRAVETPGTPQIYNLVQVELGFTWPVSTNTDREKRPGKFALHESIARY